MTRAMSTGSTGRVRGRADAAFVILPGRTGLSLFDPVWMTSAPDLALSLGLQLLLSAGIVVLIRVRLAQRLRWQPPAHA